MATCWVMVEAPTDLLPCRQLTADSDSRAPRCPASRARRCCRKFLSSAETKAWTSAAARPRSGTNWRRCSEYSARGAVGRVDPRHNGRLVLCELFVVWQILLGFPNDVPRSHGDAAEDDETGGEQEPQKSQHSVKLPCPGTAPSSSFLPGPDLAVECGRGLAPRPSPAHHPPEARRLLK